MKVIFRLSCFLILFSLSMFLTLDVSALENVTNLITVEKTAVGGGGGFIRGDGNADQYGDRIDSDSIGNLVLQTQISCVKRFVGTRT